MELRVPNKQLAQALANQETKVLWFYVCAKLKGPRTHYNDLWQDLKLNSRTARRLLNKLLQHGWAGYDHHYIFTRSWSRLGLSKKGGLYLVDAPMNFKKFECLCFAQALKRFYRKMGGPHSTRRRIEPEDLPSRYLAKSLGLSLRRFERLKQGACKFKFISSIPQFRVVGLAKDFDALRKHLPGLALIKRGKHTVTPEASKIKVLI